MVSEARNRRENRECGGQGGFTLVELAIVIAIAGVITGLAVAFALPILETARRLETEGKMEKIERAIGQYAVANYRLPCPADPDVTPAGGEPFGTERGSGPAGDAIPAVCATNSTGWWGMLPYRTLGLDRSMAFDGYGRPFTYTISPAFSQDTSSDAMTVHALCRTTVWYTLVSDDIVDSGGGTRIHVVQHRNPRKARFCCPGIAPFPASSDIVVQNGAGTPALTSTRPGTAMTNDFCPPAPPAADACTAFDCCSAAYDTTARPYSLAPNVAIADTDGTGAPVNRVAAIAYLVVSHGPNGGNAAYDLNTGSRPPIGGLSADEAENADDDTVFRDISARGDSYDDTVLWRTQDLIFAGLGESCAVP